MRSSATQRRGRLKLTGTKLHKNRRSKAPRKKNKPEKKCFKGPTVAWRNLGARAAATREGTLCIPFVSSVESPQQSQGIAGKGVTLILGMPRSCVHAGGSSSCWAAPQTCQNPKGFLLLRAGGTSRCSASPRHPLPFWQLFKTLPGTLGKGPAQEAVLLQTFACPEVSLARGLDALQSPRSQSQEVLNNAHVRCLQ